MQLKSESAALMVWLKSALRGLSDCAASFVSPQPVQPTMDNKVNIIIIYMCILLDDIVTAMVRFRCKCTNILENEQFLVKKVYEERKKVQ